jgi:hypothetical protein
MSSSSAQSAPPPATPARPGGRGAAAEPPLRLEERTSSDEPILEPYQRRGCEDTHPLLTRVLRRSYPDGDCEVTVTRRPRTTQRRRGPYRSRAAGGAHERTAIQALEARARSATRARATVRRSIQAGGLDHLLTLTYRENRTDADQCDRDLTRFLRLVRAAMPAGYKYVAVFERQKRGAGHWHLAVAGWQQVAVLRALWLKVIGDGNIDVKSWVGRGRAGECSAKLAGYLSKYITKSAEGHTEFSHRYRKSHNIRIQECVEEYDESDLHRVAIAAIRRFTGRDARFILHGDAGGERFIWACSWGGIAGTADTVRRWASEPQRPS